jgi:hypothetical protein
VAAFYVIVSAMLVLFGALCLAGLFTDQGQNPGR